MAELHLMTKPKGIIKKHAIFIHGLSGHYKTSWRASGQKNEFWPSWLSEDNQGIAIWSVGYLSHFRTRAMHLTDRAANILDCLTLEGRLQEGEIILVGHSMGGLIIKQLLMVADRRKNDEIVFSFASRVNKIVFLATPHAGASKATLLDYLKMFLFPSAATLSLVRNDPNLHELNRRYKSWVLDRTINLKTAVEK